MRGPLNLASIVIFSKLTGRQVKEALLVLIHHNLVRYELREDSTVSGTSAPVIYHLDIDAVILRLAYPYFACMAEEVLGDKVAVKSHLFLYHRPEWLFWKLSNMAA